MEVEELVIPPRMADVGLPVHPRGTPVFTPDADVRALLWLSEMTTGNVVEIGCNKGLTSMRIARHQPDKIIYAMDTVQVDMASTSQHQEAPSSEDLGICCYREPNVVVVKCSSKRFDFSAFDKVTMIFIDGDHSYEGVKIDTEKSDAYLKKQQGRRFLVWHDYHPPGAADTPEWLGVGPYLRDEFNRPFFHVKGTSVAFHEL